MKDYNNQITYESQNNFVDYAVEAGYDLEVIEGALNDTYVIYNVDKQLSIKGVKARDFIILYPKFESAWSNTFHILMTDDESKAQEFLEDEELKPYALSTSNGHDEEWEYFDTEEQAYKRFEELKETEDDIHLYKLMELESDDSYEVIDSYWNGEL